MGGSGSALIRAAAVLLLGSLLAGCSFSEQNFNYGSGVPSQLAGATPGAAGAGTGPPWVRFPPPAGEAPVAWLTVPDLGLESVPIFDRDLDSARRMQIATGYTVTHYRRSSPLDDRSNAVLYAHDDIQGGVFGRLVDLHFGSPLSLKLASGATQSYTVVKSPQRVDPGATWIMRPSPFPELTIFTCYPLWQDFQRVYVVAMPVH